MPIELECKIRIPNRDSLRERLRELGAVVRGDVHEKNTLFDFADGALRKADTLLRLRCHNDDTGGVLTCKRPAIDSTFKRREETEVRVDDHAAMRELLNALGYEAGWFYEKYRETWTVQQCEVVLDRTPEMGCFIEIESPEERQIAKLLHALKLAASAHLPDSYIALWRAHCAAQGIAFCDMRFAPKTAKFF